MAAVVVASRRATLRSIDGPIHPNTRSQNTPVPMHANRSIGAGHARPAVRLPSIRQAKVLVRPASLRLAVGCERGQPRGLNGVGPTHPPQLVGSPLPTIDRAATSTRLILTPVDRARPSFGGAPARPLDRFRSVGRIRKPSLQPSHPHARQRLSIPHSNPSHPNTTQGWRAPAPPPLPPPREEGGS